jgi:hypothetical protein
MGIHRRAHRPSLIRHGPHRKRWAQQFLVSYIRCRGNGYTDALPSIHIQTHRLRGFVKYVVEMSLGVMIYIPNFMKIHSDIRKLVEGIHRHTAVTESTTHVTRIDGLTTSTWNSGKKFAMSFLYQCMVRCDRYVDWSRYFRRSYDMT